MLLEGVGIFVVLYPLFTWARGLVDASAADAYRNAQQIIDLEERLGIYREVAIQQWALPHRWLVGFWNVWYGSAHFIAPIVTLIALYYLAPARYVRWRNTYLCMLIPIVIGFWLYPLMPPGLLPASYGFVETRLSYFSIGKPQPHPPDAQFLYSAMPSMHIAFATWVALAARPLVRPRWARVAVACYPALMITSTVVTASHYFLDAVGAWVALAIGYGIASWRAWWPWPRSNGPRSDAPPGELLLQASSRSAQA